MAGEKDPLWENPKAKAVFMKMCGIAQKPSVDWKKFRALDTRGIFKRFDNSQLSMKFRNYHLREAGLCWYCATEPSALENGLCEACNDKVKKTNKNYYESTKDDLL